MSKRIIKFEDGPNGTPPAGPMTMADLLTAAESSWKKGDRQRAFITLLGAVAMMSQGVAQAMKTSDDLKARLDALHPPKE